VRALEGNLGIYDVLENSDFQDPDNEKSGLELKVDTDETHALSPCTLQMSSIIISSAVCQLPRRANLQMRRIV